MSDLMELDPYPMPSCLDEDLESLSSRELLIATIPKLDRQQQDIDCIKKRLAEEQKKSQASVVELNHDTVLIGGDGFTHAIPKIDYLGAFDKATCAKELVLKLLSVTFSEEELARKS